MVSEPHRIISDYSELLQHLSIKEHGMPESLLPHPRQSIRAALIEGMRSMPPGESVPREALKQCLFALASFVSDPEAEIAAKFHEALASGDTGHEYWKLSDEAFLISRRIAEERELLQKETDSL